MKLNRLAPIIVLLLVVSSWSYLSQNWEVIFGKTYTPPLEDVCGECHKELPSRSLYGMVHDLPPGGLDHEVHINAKVKCWECHTPSKPIKEYSREEIVNLCLNCHSLSETIFHDVYLVETVDCRNCHSGWVKGEPSVNLNLTLERLCDECHGGGFLFQALSRNCTLQIHIPLLGCPEYCHRGEKHEEWLKFTGNTLICTSCHNLYKMPFHDMLKPGSNCMACHNFTGPIIVTPELNCFSCHPERIKEEIESTGYHKIHTSLSLCTTCHHGTSHREWFKSASKVEACIGCHSTSEISLHDMLPAGTYCVSCHTQWLEEVPPKPLIPCEGCHGVGYVDSIVKAEMHKSHLKTLNCSDCHVQKTHLTWFNSVASPKNCLECHTVKGETTGYPSKPIPKHEIYVNATSGDCFVCHRGWKG